ncbi:WSC domain-containing protein [Cercophora samala]|uniref:WSC domain-containing protein n=1 Tax=Cercophora samala TaxID=330535 RepID=A0AA39ZM24_9PEZI|nr:WSC domain-containing protein [Cercophora samala]
MKLLITLLLSVLGGLVAAQAQKEEVAILPGGQGYTYHGCYTETTNIANTTSRRALDGGSNSVQPDLMTVEKCWDFCAKGTYKFAGLEYSRECWCSQTLSTLANKLADKECDLPCDGNTTQSCGGSLKLTVYITSAAAAANLASSFSLFITLGLISVLVSGSVL